MTVQNNLLTVQLAQILTAITAGHLCKKEKKKEKQRKTFEQVIYYKYSSEFP